MQNRFKDELERALNLFNDVEKLIVSDEYPPFTTGGAEISLHELVTHDESNFRSLVVKFTNPRSEIRYYRYQSVHVLELPASNVWRPSGNLLFDIVEKRHILPTLISRAIRMTWDAGCWLRLLARSARGYNYFCAAILHLGRSPIGGVLLDSIEDQYALRADLLNCILNRLKPPILIANNTRSIVTCYYGRKRYPLAWRKVRTLAMVRDNRFACPRYNQIMRVAGKDCTSCQLDCAAEDASTLARLQRHLLQRTAETRRKALSSFDTVTVTSDYLKRQICALLPQKSDIRLVPNFVRPPDMPSGVAIQADDEGQADRIAIIGSINEAKGQLEFIKSSVCHLRANPAMRIVVIGKGERLQKRIEALLRREQLMDRVTFTGFLKREELFEEIKKSKIVVLPTLWPEPFGRVPLEAGLCRRPVVSFRSGGLEESIRHEVTGYLVDKENYEDLWTKILNLLGDSTKRDVMGTAGLEFINERYSAEIANNALRLALGMRF